MPSGSLPPILASGDISSGVLRWVGGELDLRTAQVRRAGVLLSLDRSSYEVLLALLLRAGQVLSKDDLLDAAWPGRVVSENSLAKAISRLRRELGDVAGSALQSVHGYGYRWAGEVQWLELDRSASDEMAVVDGDSEHWLGQEVPYRPGWRFSAALGRGAHSRVLLAESDVGDAPRAIKMGVGEEGLRHVRREVALHRYLTALDRSIPGLTPALGWQLDEPPVFVEYPYFEDGDLARWMTAHNAGNGLSLDQRVALVAQIADTLAELHASGVVHQDLKPGNIFLRADPSLPEGWRTALADLGGGYASPLPQMAEGFFDDAALGGESPSDRMRAGTAIYCAPEVLAGGLPTQRSDLFSLGVLLFQMVVGDVRRPFAPGWESDVSDPLLQQDIRELAALRPERRSLSAAQVADRLRTLPQRRAAAREADEDAVRAQTLITQLQRQRRRLRLLGVASAALMFGLAVASWTGWLAIEARKDEQKRREDAQAVLSFLTSDLLTRADPYLGGMRDISLRKALDEAADGIDERLGASPEVAATVHDAVSGAYESWGNYPQAAFHLRRSMALLDSDDGAASVGAATRQRALCGLERQAGKLDQAQAACDQAALLDAEGVGEVSLATHVEMARLDFERGQCDPVVTVLQPAVDRAEWAIDSSFADALSVLGRCRSRLAEDGAAIDALRRLVKLQVERFGPDHPRTGWALAELSDVLVSASRYSEAEATVDRMADVFANALGPEHPDSLIVAFRRGQIAAGLGRDADAALAFAEAYRGWERLLGARHVSTLLAGSEYARSLARAGERASAEVIVARQQMEAAAALAQGGARATDFHEIWAETLLSLGRLDEAGFELAAFDASAEGVVPLSHPRRASMRCLASRLASLRGDVEAAGEALAACRLGLARVSPKDARRRLLADAEAALGSSQV